MALKHLHPQHHLHSFTLCNSPSSNFKHGFHFLLPKYPSKLHIQSHFTTHSAANQQPNISRRILDKIEKGFSSFGDKDHRVSKKIAFLGENDNGVGSRKGKNVSFESNDQRVSKKVTFLGENLDNGNGVGSDKVKNGKKGKIDSSLESKERMVSKKVAFLGDRMDNGNVRKKAKNSEVDSSFVCKEQMDSENGVDGKKFKRPKKGKLDSPVVILRIGLEICSKLGDVMGAIGIFDLAKKEGITLSQYHYAVILYLCSSAAVGVVQPAKSGRSGTNLDKKSRLFEEPSGELDRVSQTLDDVVQLINDHENSKGRTRIEVGDNVKEYALKRGFEIYEEMVSDDVPMNEAILTSLARMAMSRNDGDIAFDMVKKMKDLGINPRLRSYGPALSVFCNNGNLEKAFEVEEHMLSHGVYPEEPELELLLRVSIEACRSDKVYYLLHKLRTSVRKVLPSTADVIEKWFNSKTASRVGKRKWDQRLIN
ncbi:pentatricopeptide repeat-containing protein, partial [Tanacetum coccineum]